MPLRLTVKSTSTVSDGHQVGMATPFLHLGELNLKTVWNIQPDTVLYVFNPSSKNSYIRRMYASNGYEVTYNGKDTVLRTSIPFVTNGIKTGMDILMARLNKPKTLFRIDLHGGKEIFPSGGKEVKSQPLDSMLRPMMHRSDNFYAEQTLLMASNELIGYMSDRDMIDTMMKTDFKDMPDKPVWADGSGLSRYNLQSPANYVWLLDKMRKEYNMERLKDILPTGNDGTLTNYYKELSGKMFAKTGTLSGVVALSGYLYAKSGKLLLFSVLVNNHNTEAAKVRRQVERYLMGVWEAN
jgi:D-alanyl-D-alanine carboxypeptidase/D-alanyl-D-alanine-endopeptidase (penicillin-binding protein 4)